MMYSDAVQAVNTLVRLVPLLGDSRARKDYEEAVKLTEYLVEFEPDSPLIDMLTTKIDAYEESAPEFAEFNARIAAAGNGLTLLRTLMDQYGLNTSDLKEEIGSKSLVSRVLRGERTLTLEHMRKLSRRFGIPVSRFVD
jgi:HTH-type transcriptional regulator/antitoxin HigA